MKKTHRRHAMPLIRERGPEAAAWQILLDCGVNRLPVDLNSICRELGVKTLSYSAAARLIAKGELEAEMARRHAPQIWARKAASA